MDMCEESNLFVCLFFFLVDATYDFKQFESFRTLREKEIVGCDVEFGFYFSFSFLLSETGTEKLHMLF